MANKSVSDIRSEMITALNSFVPTLDLSDGSPERDIFIEAPISGQLANLWSQTNYNSQLISPILNYKYLSNTDIENYCANFNISRILATKSSGYALFYAYSVPTNDISIKAGTLISTNSSTASYFEVTSTFSVSISNIASYFNITNNRYEFLVYVESQNAGSAYRAGAGTLTSLDSSVSGIDGVTNMDSISGGADAESNYNMLQRVIAVFQSRGLLNSIGISNYVRDYDSTVLTVGAGDALMERDGGVGGCIDVYIKGFVSGTHTDMVTITADGLVNSDISGYSSTYIKLSKPPVYTIAQVLINDVSVLASYYTLVSDTTSTVKRSPLANDKLVLTSAGLEALTGFQKGSTVSVEYTYNDKLYTISDKLTSASNGVNGRNYLVRELIEVPISIVVYVSPSTGYTISDLNSTWSSVVSNYLDTLPNGASISKSGLISLLKGISTLSGFDLNRLYFCATSSGTPTALNTSDPLTLEDNCYSSLGVVTFNEWTA